MIFHLVWEAALFVLTAAAMLYLLIQSDFKLGGGFWPNLASLGLLAAAFAVSMRTSTANLAVGAMAALAGVVFAKLMTEDVPAPIAGLVALALMAAIGALLGVITGLTKAPGWLVSLAPFALVPPIVVELLRRRPGRVPDLDLPPILDALLWMAVFVIPSLVGGVLFLIPAVRKVLGGGTFVGALVGFTASSLLAGLSGVVWTAGIGLAPTSADTSRMLLAIGAVLLGGVSVFSGRGGVAGTVLAVTFLFAAGLALTRQSAPGWVVSGLIPAVAILVGVAMSWVRHRFLEPEPVDAERTETGWIYASR